MKHLKLLFVFAILVFVSVDSRAQDQETAELDTAQINKDEVILVAGATGRTGGFVVEQLQALGYTSIRGMTRDKEKAIAEHGNDIEWIQGDVRDPESLKAAFAGADKLISTIGAGRTPDNLPEVVGYGGVKNMVDAAKESGVQHFALMSSAGVTHEDNELNKMFHNVAVWKLKGEDYLRDSGLSYSIIRPGGLASVTSKGEYGIYLGQGDRRTGGQVSRQDVAAILIESLTNPDAAGKTFEVFNFIARFPESWRNDFGLLAAD